MENFLTLDFWIYVLIELFLSGCFIWGLFGILMIFEHLPDRKKDIDK